MRIITLACLLSCLTYGNAFAHNETAITHYIYEGTLGSQKITFAIIKSKDKDGKDIQAAHYFYDKYRKDIPLAPSENNVSGDAEFTEYTYNETCYLGSNTDNCETNGLFKLQETNYGLLGIWINSKNQTHSNVKLKKVSSKEFKAHSPINNYSSLIYTNPTNDNGDLEDGFYLSDPYQSRLLSGELIYGKSIKTADGISYKTVTDKQTGVHYILLDEFPDKKIRQDLNKRFLNYLCEMKSYALECAAYSEKIEKPFFSRYGYWEDYSSKVKYLNRNLLVIEETGSTYCGGAHPQNSYFHSVYDLVKGTDFNFNYYFNFYTPDADNKDEMVQSAEYTELKKEFFPTSKYWIKQDIDAETLQYCTGSDMKYLEFSQSFNKQGMVFSLEGLPHVSGVCMRDYYLVPYKNLVPLMTKTGKQFFANEINK
jgi:hypothetical protein